jgi:hypothetical protein
VLEVVCETLCHRNYLVLGCVSQVGHGVGSLLDEDVTCGVGKQVQDL